MSGTFRDIFSLSVQATAALTANRFITVPGGAVPAAAAGNVGVARTSAAIGDYVSTVLVGTATVEAGAAFAKGASLEVDASGRGITKAAGVTVGRALEASTAAGQMVEVLLLCQ